MKLNFSSILKNISFIAIIIGALGILVLNLSYSKYYFAVFQTINANFVFIGLVFVLFMIAHFLVYSAFYNYSDLSKNNFGFIIVTSLAKLIFLTNFVMIIFKMIDVPNVMSKLPDFLGYLYQFHVFTIWALPLWILSLYEYLVNEKTPYAKSIWSVTILLFIYTTYVFVVNIIFSPLTKTIILFEFIVLFFTVFTISNLIVRAKDKADGVKIYSNTIFSKSPQDRNILDNVYFYLSIIVFVFSVATLYSHLIFKNIDSARGGGKFNTIEIVTEQDTIQGLSVFQTSKYIFIEKDSVIHKINWDDVKMVVPRK